MPVLDPRLIFVSSCKFITEIREKCQSFQEALGNFCLAVLAHPGSQAEFHPQHPMGDVFLSVMKHFCPPLIFLGGIAFLLLGRVHLEH